VWVRSVPPKGFCVEGFAPGGGSTER
jgi:hypothetical protein